MIYDVNNGNYFFFLFIFFFISKNINTGNALSLVSNNELSNTGMNIITPLGKGMKLVSGIDVLDNTRSMSMIGIYNSLNTLIPSQTIISGNTIIKNRSTMGINYLFSETENYVLDVNGPLKINHNEILVIKNVNYFIQKTIFYDIDKRYGIAFGNSTERTNIITLKKTYQQNILYTIDKGQTWNESVFYESDGSIISIISIKLLCGYIYNSSVGIIGGDAGIILFSIDGFQTWHRINGNCGID